MERYFVAKPNFTNSTTNKNNNKLTHVVTLILSKHVYISLLILFSPYLLNLFIYLYPLFITTSLLLLSLLTALLPLDSIINSRDGFFTTSYNTLLEVLHTKGNNEHGRMQHVEVFEAYRMVFETPLFSRMEEIADDVDQFEETPVWFCKENIQYGSNVNVEKIFEPHFDSNVSSEERMDLLWETYETEEVNTGENGEKMKELMVISDNHKVNYGDNDEENSENGQLCCLKALKLSAGKMNLGMGRPSLVKFGKVFKGIGWLEKHVRRKHIKRG